MKADEIRDYFDGWQENLARVKSLMEVPEYYREAWLVLCCYVGAFGSLRYPGLRDNEKYKKAVREYSGMTDFYDQIDLLNLTRMISLFNYQALARCLNNGGVSIRHSIP